MSEQQKTPNQEAAHDVKSVNDTIDNQGLEFDSKDDQMQEVNQAIELSKSLDGLKMDVLSTLLGPLDPLNCISSDAVDDHDKGAKSANGAVDLIKKGVEFVAENPEVLALA